MKRFAVIFSLAACWGAAPSAATPTVKESDAEARLTLARFSNCVVRRFGPKLRALIDVPYEGEGVKSWQPLMVSECLEAATDANKGQTQLRFSGRLMRGGVFEALYRTDYEPSPVIANFADVAPIAYPGIDRRVMMVGDCAVRKMPEQARALLGAKVTTKAEQTVLDGMSAVRSECLNGTGLMTIGDANYRGGIAEALYRLTMAKLAPTSSKSPTTGGGD